MVIESTSTKTIIDLLESLRKNSFTSTAIRVSYTLKGSKTRYMVFETLDDLKSFYTNNYYRTVQSKKNPYTDDPRLAIQEPISTTVGQLIYSTNEDPVQYFFESIPFFCSTGALVTLESVNITSYMRDYNMSLSLIHI